LATHISRRRMAERKGLLTRDEIIDIVLIVSITRVIL
jgi:hypothetical protein